MKQRSEKGFFYEFADGSEIRTQILVNDDIIPTHLFKFENYKATDQIELWVIKSVVDNYLNTPIGAIPSMRPTAKKEFIFTITQFKEFIKKFWEVGPEYFDTI